MTPLYTLVATTMERLGIQPIRAGELDRRQPSSQGRRFQDSGWQFLIDHAILTAIEFAVAYIAYSLFFGGAR